MRFPTGSLESPWGSPSFPQHSLNVATMAVVLGRELNLPNASLADLGVAALFHDVGYTAGEAGRTVSFGAHSVQGVRVLLRQRGFHEAKIRRLLVTLQHHWRYDHTPKPTLFARIIHIAEDYDTFTRSRPDGPLMTPVDTLARMVGGAGSQYDPVLMQMLVTAWASTRLGHCWSWRMAAGPCPAQACAAPRPLSCPCAS